VGAKISSGVIAASGRSGYKARLALYLAAVAVYADMYITQPILPLLSHDFGVAPAVAGLTVSSVVLAIALASSSYGPLGDAFGRKRVMVVSGMLLAAPTLACALAGSFGTLLALRALQGLLIPGISAVAVAYIGEQFEAADLGALVGSFISATVAGGLIGRVGSGLIAGALSWRAPFVVFAAVTLLSAVMLGLTLSRDRPTTHAGWGHAYRGMLAHLREPRLLGAFLIGGSLFFGFIGVFTYLPYYLAAPPFRLSTTLVSSIYVVYLAGVIASPLAGRLSARHSRQRLMAIGMLVAVAGIVGTLMPALPAIIASLVVLCAGMFTAQAIAPAFVNANARAAKGGANALYLAFYYVGATLGSSLPGLAWQTWGWQGVVTSSVAALTLGLLADWLLCSRP
jgi:YNFM family putative membrane transporter